MPYEVQSWNNEGTLPKTPIDAERLSHIEDGIKAEEERAEAAEARAIPLTQKGTAGGVPESEGALKIEGTAEVGAVLTGEGSNKARLKPHPVGTLLPSRWDAQWRAAKAAAEAATGTAKIAVVGDSYVSGQSSGTVTDCLLYGFVGRLDAMLAPSLGGYAEGYTIGGVAPGNLASPSSPYPSSVGAFTAYDGGVSQVWGPSATAAIWLTITAKKHPVTGAYPTKIDLFTIDFDTHKWSYKIDGGAETVVTCEGSGTIGDGVLRRTSITLSGTAEHAIELNNLEANGLIFMGHVAYYAASGLGIMRAGLPGFRAIDFATGPGAEASSSGGYSLTPDHIKPWSGVEDAYNKSAATFPWKPDLLIVHVGGNDCTYGGSIEAMRNALTRMIVAGRRGIPSSAATPGASVLILGAPYPSEYGENASATNRTSQWQKYKSVLVEMAQSYGCAWLDLQEVFGEDDVARGLVESGLIHPTQDGHGTGGGDGHMLIAESIKEIL
ncbi:MAG: SGNH/GDSL hydrolase family protein [Patescibacteria group bacterium]|nr:SGNH/GDSL hydrolase family protein [Patescibacteria group bacterium]